VAEKRLVLSDASPLIALAATGGFGLLRELFGNLTITAAVRDEVLAGGARAWATDLRRALRARWIRVQRVPRNAPAVKPVLARLVEYGFHISPELGQSVLGEAGER